MATVTWLVYLPSKNRFREIIVDGSTGRRGVNGKPTANSRFKHARMRSRGNSICQFFLWTQAFPFFFVHCSAELLYSSSLACQNKFGSRQIMKRLSSSHIYDRSIHTQHLSLVCVRALPSNKVPQNSYLWTFGLPLKWACCQRFSWSLVMTFFFPSSRSDLTLESPSIRQASSRTKPKNAASIFDGASSTDVHKKNKNNQRSSKWFLRILILTFSKRQWCRFHHGDERKPGNFDQQKSISQFRVEVHVKQWTSTRHAHVTSGNVKENVVINL